MHDFYSIPQYSYNTIISYNIETKEVKLQKENIFLYIFGIKKNKISYKHISLTNQSESKKFKSKHDSVYLFVFDSEYEIDIKFFDLFIEDLSIFHTTKKYYPYNKIINGELIYDLESLSFINSDIIKEGYIREQYIWFITLEGNVVGISLSSEKEKYLSDFEKLNIIGISSFELPIDKRKTYFLLKDFRNRILNWFPSIKDFISLYDKEVDSLFNEEYITDIITENNIYFNIYAGIAQFLNEDYQKTYTFNVCKSLEDDIVQIIIDKNVNENNFKILKTFYFSIPYIKHYNIQFCITNLISGLIEYYDDMENMDTEDAI